MPLVEQELLTLPKHMISPPGFSEVRVTRSLVLCAWFVDCCLSFCTFSFGHCVVCSSSIYRFCLLLWHLQPLRILFFLIFDPNTYLNMVSLDLTFWLGTTIYFEHRCRWKMNLIREQEISKNEIQPQIITTIFFLRKTHFNLF